MALKGIRGPGEEEITSAERVEEKGSEDMDGWMVKESQMEQGRLIR